MMLTEQPYVLVDEPPARPCPFINLNELLRCLSLYFEGTLDEVDEAFFERLYLPLEQLIPHSSLESQLDSDMMTQALSQLPELYRAAIKVEYLDDPESHQLIAHYLAPGYMLIELESYLLTHAINQLADTIHRML